MSTSGVKAGQAYVELSVKDRLTAGLARAKERLAAWAKGLAIVGTAVQAGAASVLGTLGAAVRHFADRGSQLNDLSVATGVGTEALSALGYAAQQTGVDLDALHGGLKGMAKFTGQVANGNKAATHSLAQLGISASQFLAAKPEQRLALLADGLQTVADPGLRAALAMKTMGKAGEALLPMLADGSAGLNAFVDRARELGIVVSAEEAAKADALGDAWDDLKAVFSAIAFQTGAALADTMQVIIATLIKGAQVVLEFVRNNQGLIVTLAAAAVAGMVLGGVILALAGAGMVLSGVMAAVNALVAIGSGAWAVLGAIKATVAAINTWLAATLTAEGLAALWATIQTTLLSGAMGILATVTGAAAAVLTFFTTPLGLIVLAVTLVSMALAAGAIWFFQYTEAGKFTVSTLSELFRGLWQTATQTFRGIFDALMSGRWDLAAEVAMAGLEVAYRRGLLAIRSLWSGFKEWLIGLFADMFAGIFQMLADFQAKLVGGVNYIREKLGFEPIQGLRFVNGWAEGAANKAGEMKAQAERNREQEVQASQDKLDAAQSRLDKATGAAHDAREEQARKRKAAFAGLTGALGNLPHQGVTAPGGTTLGTFSAAVAGLLGRSGPDDAAERTAQHTEAMEEHLEAIRRQVEEGGLAFE